VQATFNASCAILHLLSVLCPEGKSDSKAFCASNIFKLVKHLPDGFYFLDTLGKGGAKSLHMRQAILYRINSDGCR
jgi:hypothetical protein